MSKCLPVFLAIFFVCSVNAQEEQPKNEARLKPESRLATLSGITVTATRTKREVFQVPETVNIIGGEQLLRKQAADIGDVLEDIPGVAIVGGGRNIGTRINIRGLDDSRVLFLLDGARQDFNRAHNSRVFLDPGLIKQVEVVRGPSSAIWGSGALGGVVAFTTMDAIDLLAAGKRIGARLNGGFQSANSQGLGSGSIYGLVGDTFDYLLDFSYRNASDTRLGDGSNLRNSSFESYSSLAKFNWNPGLYHNLMFSSQTFDQTGGVPSNPQIASTPDTLVDRDTEQRNFTLRYRYENADKALLAPEILVFHNITKSNENRLFDRRRDLTEFTTTGINVRNSSQVNWADGRLLQTFTYGMDYHHNEAKAKRNGAPRDSFPDAQTDIVGVYLQDEIAFWERFILTPGVRWDYFRSQSNGSGAAEDNKDNEVSYKIGGVIKITDWLSVIGAYNEAFRAPNLSELYTTGTHFTCGPGCANLFVPNPNIKPEKAFNREFGLRLEKDDFLFAGDSIRFRGTYFHNRVENFIDLAVGFSPIPVPGNQGAGGVTTNDNVRDAVLKGFETEFSYDAEYGYLGASYVQTRGSNRTDGGPLSNVQPDKWIIRTGLNWPTYNLSLGWRGSVVEAQNRVPTDGAIAPTPSYVTHDLMLAWVPQHGQFKNLRVDFGIDNITDEDFRRHLAILRDPGRNYKVAVRYQF